MTNTANRETDGTGKAHGRDHAAATDIAPDSRVLAALPARLRPYGRLARLDRPIGTWLLLIPCWWGLALGWHGHPSLAVPPPWYFLLFAIGAIVMRGAGCTWNDVTDRDYDGRVARTALRPIPAGEVSVRQALVFMVLLSLAGLAVLLQFNAETVAIGAASLLLVAGYPFMKRITYWPQAWLGLTFNWGVLVGWSSMQPGLALPALVMYAAGVLWTLGYDTIYAHQDKEDDALIGVKSTALRFGTASKPWVAGFYAGTILLLGLAGWLAGLGAVFAVALGLGALHFARQVAAWRLDDPKDCLKHFRSNRDFGLIVLAGIVLDGVAGDLAGLV